jgi:hypothetical protein
MPCYRCGTRQTDPDKGQSPWKRGVRDDSQVLICPQCQAGRDWTSDLERCSVCRSVRLVRRLGEVECRDCGRVREAAEPAAADARSAAEGGGPAADLAEEVARALDRVLGPHRVTR